MNVLMTADAVGGVWSYSLSLARALGALGTQVTLAVMGPAPSAAQRAAAATVPGLELRELDAQLEWMDDPWDDVARAGRWLLALEAELRPDVVHLNGYAHAALPWRVPAVVVAHSCVLSWWEAVRGGPAPAAWDAYRGVVTHGIAAAELVVAPTAAMLAAVERHYGRPRASAVVPNAARAADFAPAAKEPFVLTAGRLWDEAKNIAALDAVAPALAWPVHAAGDTRHPAGTGAGMRHVHALGPLAAPDLAGWMARASIYALPARYEPFGLSALEAAFAGCALVLGDIPSLREVWGDAAVFVPPDDHAALARALASLIADDRAREALAARARLRAQRFTPARMAAAYAGLYARVAPTAVAQRRPLPIPA